MANLSGLEALAALLQKGGPMARAKIQELGRLYRQVLKDNPSALTYGSTPAENRADIATKYGVKMHAFNDPLGEHDLPMFRFSKGNAGIDVSIDKGSELEEAANEAGQYGLGLTFKPAANYGVIHAIENEQGGNAGELYPAALDMMRQMGIRNASDTYVTPVNAWRKPLANTIGSLIRADKNLVIPHPKSLAHTGLSPLEYLQSDFDTQVGENLVNGVMGMHKDLASGFGATNLGDIRKTLAANTDFPGRLAAFYDTSPEAVQAIDNFRPDYMDYAGLTGSSTPGDVADIAALLHAAGVRSVGPASLKKTLLLDSFMQGKDFNPALLPGIEKKTGGLVQTQPLLSNR